MVASVSPGAVRELHDRVAAIVSGQQAPLNGHGSNAVARMFAWGNKPIDGLRQILAFPTLTRIFFAALDQDGYTSPTLTTRGALTDTEGDIQIRYKLYNATPGTFVDSYLYSETYHLPEEETGRHSSRNATVSTNPTVGTSVGELTKDPHAITNDSVSVSAPNVSFGQTRGRTDTAVLKLLRGIFRNRKVQYLQVNAGLMVHIKVKAANVRWRTKLGHRLTPKYFAEGYVEMAFQFDNAVQFLMDPETLLENANQFAIGVHEHPVPHGIPITSGRYFPGPGDTPQRFQAANALPHFSRSTVVAGHYDAALDHMLVGAEVMNPERFAEHLRATPGWADNPLVVLVAGGAGQNRIDDGAANLSFAARLAAALTAQARRDIHVLGNRRRRVADGDSQQ